MVAFSCRLWGAVVVSRHCALRADPAARSEWPRSLIRLSMSTVKQALEAGRLVPLFLQASRGRARMTNMPRGFLIVGR